MYLQFPEYSDAAKVLSLSVSPSRATCPAIHPLTSVAPVVAAQVAAHTNNAANTLAFTATLPPVGWNTYFVTRTQGASGASSASGSGAKTAKVTRAAAPSKVQPPAAAPVTISNDLWVPYGGNGG